jgi:hypothetical protein
LKFWEKAGVEEDWTTDDEEESKNQNKEKQGTKKGEEDEEIEEIDDEEEDLIEIFTLDSCKEEQGGKYSCNFCKEVKKLPFKKMKQHFIDTHKEQFKTYFGDEGNFIYFLIILLVDWDDAVKKSKKNKGPGGNPFAGGNPFMNMGNMGGMFDMGSMFGASPKETEEMMKEFEKMMFGGGMGGMGGGMGNMGDLEAMFGGAGGKGGKKGGKKKK